MASVMPRSTPGVPSWWHDRVGRQAAQGSRTGEQPAEEAAGRSPSGYQGTEGSPGEKGKPDSAGREAVGEMQARTEPASPSAMPFR